MIGQTISHYKITGELGAGGMGVVYEAVDTKLDRIVALKFLPPESLRDPDAKARFIHEAKAASSLDHPNICTIHAIEEAPDGRLFIAMASYEGETLKDMIGRGPLDIPEIIDISIQTLQGLAKAHRLGIVHRDIKPANVLVTSEGLVKLLDFGIAKLAGQTQVTKTGSMLGTVHYMAPEQLQGMEVDRRADLWSVGVLLYEMLTGRLPFTGDHQAAVMYAILNTDPEPVADVREEVPAELVQAALKCLGKEPTERYQGTEELLLDLKPLISAGATQTLRARTAGLRNLQDYEFTRPYPGLASFTENDAEFFHGRESQVESVWQKLRGSRLLAVTGPSGVGKTSFLRAGLIPAKPADWGIIFAKPGATPLLSLREALVREISGDTEGIVALLRESDTDTDVATMRRWRQNHDEALVILDQFEELFTLSPPEEQERFAELLSRLTFEADVHILVSLRDDFLYHCRNHAGLTPLFESLTVLVPLAGPTLRNALVQPSMDCGYVFEDETLVDEMMAEVEGERGALPLLAFAMAQLWERRDRDEGLLTRQAYEQMGAVSGALAQHAEAVMDRIGSDRHAVVREMFRNLVTAQSTRAVPDRDHLLSVFGASDRPAAQAVLGELIDARLLTSYEVKDEEGEARQRIEIVHESLLKAWPRLVRWQTQDADGAQLRDQLRQAAQLWEQKDRTGDLLWTGTAFQEFELWRERYSGGLSSSENEFASAMKSRNRRRIKRRRIAVTGAFLALFVVLAVVASFGKRSERMARLYEARKLHMLAEERLDTDNTLALALATAGLERNENPDLRRLALRALWKAPVRSVLSVPDTMPLWQPSLLSPDGHWLATVNEDGVLLWPRNGEEPIVLISEETAEPYQTRELFFHTEGQFILAKRTPVDLPHRTAFGRMKLSLWSVPDGRLIRTWNNPEPGWCYPFLRGEPPYVIIATGNDPNLPLKILRYSLESDNPDLLGDGCSDCGEGFWVDKAGRFLHYAGSTGLFKISLDRFAEAEPIPVGSHPNQVSGLAFSDDEDFLASSDQSGEVRVWSRQSDGRYVLEFSRLTGDQGVRIDRFDHSGSQIIYKTNNLSQVFSLKLMIPWAQPIKFLPQMAWPGKSSFTPDDNWLVYPWSDDRFGGGKEVFFYSLTKQRASVFRVLPEDPDLTPNFFLPDGSQLAATTSGGELWLCEVISSEPTCRLLWRNPCGAMWLPPPGPRGRYILVNGFNERKGWMIPVDGSEPRMLGETEGPIAGVAIDPEGNRAAVGGTFIAANMEDEPVIRIRDLETDELRVLKAKGESGFYGLNFLPDNRLLSHGNDGLLLWSLDTGDYQTISKRKHLEASDLDSQRRFLVVDTPEGVTLWDLKELTERILPISSDELGSLAISPDGRFVVAGMSGGAVYVLPLDSEEPYLMIGHDSKVTAVWISPASDEIRTASSDGTVCVWEVPTGPRTHNLPRAEFLAMLREQTNMRVVTDVESEEGFRVEYDRFPGWETAPEW